MIEVLPGNRITMEAAASLSAGVGVKIDTSGRAALASDEGADFIGVVVENGGETAAPYSCVVQIDGIATMISDGSGAIDEGENVTINGAAGKIKAVTPADGATLRGLCGVAMSPAAATDGLEVRVLLRPARYIGA